MAYTSFKVREIINHAVGHEWSIPEFQRGFVWKATQVRDLSNKNPLDYFERYKIDTKKRAQQFISGEVPDMTVEKFPNWLEERAEELALASNGFLDQIAAD